MGIDYPWRKNFNKKICVFLLLFSLILSFASPILADEPEETVPLTEEEQKWISSGDEKIFDYSFIWKVAAAAVIIIVSIIFWNRRLAHEVAKRTKALELNKHIVSNSSIGTVVFRFSGECIMANKAAAQLIGKPVEEILKEDFRQLKKWQDTGFHDLAEKALESEEEQTGEIINTGTSSGKTISMHCRFLPFRFKKEKHLLLMFEDISERKRAEEALREKEQKYRTLFNSASDAIFIMQGDRFLDCNLKTLEMFGCEREDIDWKSPSFFSPEKQPDGSDSIKKARYYTVQALRGNPQFFEWKHRRKDGTLFDAEVKLNAIELGKEKKVQAIVRDVTERKRVEEALKRSEEKYRLIAENAMDVIFTLDNDLNYTYISPSVERQRGFTPDEILKHGADEFLPPPSRRTIKKIFEEEFEIEKKISNGIPRPRKMELEVYTKAGDLLCVEAVVSFIYDRDNNPVGILGTTRDITERKREEEERAHLKNQLLQTQKMESLGVLAGGIAHDFNNILSSIFGYTELAKMNITMGENTEDYLTQVLNAATRAKNLVKQILTFSRQSDIQKKSTAVRPLIRETIKFIRSSIPATIEINYDLGDKDLTVLAEPTQIHQIIMNLCTNAAHAMMERGGILDVRIKEVEITDEETVQLREIKRGKYLQLTVSDTGTGIKDTVIDHIFDPFFTTKERGEGTGLGLSVIHGIVKDMEGAISVYSEPDKGTTFQLLLPEFGEDPGEKTSEPQEVFKGEGRILLVDDEKTIVDSGHKILRGLGYEVTSTISSIDAFKIFEANPDNFDLVLTDMTMPKMTGLELSRKILKIRPEIPIILCTGYSLGLTEAMIRKNGIRQMIMKPIISRELASAINELLIDKEE